MIIVTVMVIQIPYGLCQLVLQRKMDLFLGTQKHVVRHLPQHTVLEELEKSRFVLYLSSISTLFAIPKLCLLC